MREETMDKLAGPRVPTPQYGLQRVRNAEKKGAESVPSSDSRGRQSKRGRGRGGGSGSAPVALNLERPTSPRPHPWTHRQPLK